MGHPKSLSESKAAPPGPPALIRTVRIHLGKLGSRKDIFRTVSDRIPSSKVCLAAFSRGGLILHRLPLLLKIVSLFAVPNPARAVASHC
jgi:hypothetical protein